MSLVLESCLITSLTQSLMPSFCGSSMSLAGTIHGPIGQASSKHFWPTQSHLNGVASGKLVAAAEVARRQLVGDRVARD